LLFPSQLTLAKGKSKHGRQRVHGEAHGLCRAGLPDGLFSDQKSQFGLILEDVRLKNVDIYFMTIWNILTTFGIFYDYFVHSVFIFSSLGILHQEKSGNPDVERERRHFFPNRKNNKMEVMCQKSKTSMVSLFFSRCTLVIKMSPV
jgi:hypothetical protein